MNTLTTQRDITMRKISALIIFTLTSSSICEEPQHQTHTIIFKKLPQNIRNKCAIIEICSSINSNEKVNKACGRIANGIYCGQNHEDSSNKRFCDTVSSPLRNLMIIQEELNLHAQVVIDCINDHQE